MKKYLSNSSVERDEATMASIRGAEVVWQGPGKRRRLLVREANYPVTSPRRPDIRVGIIMDDFSTLAFSHEWTVVELRPGTWDQQLRDENLSFVVVTSARADVNGLWRSRITSPSGPAQVFCDLLDRCRAAGIPSVFWNQEDPPSYEDFLPAAGLFDHVFTTDANMVPRYQSDLGHSRVSVLPFAAQPRIHNPIRPRQGWHSRDIAVAVMFSAHKFLERREQGDYLLPAALDVCEGRRPRFEIISLQQRKKLHPFPGLPGKHLGGSLSYSQMLTAYKTYKIFLNVNTTTETPSICTRRTFEITAAGSTVLSTPSTAIAEFFPDNEIPTARTRTEAAHLLKALLANPDYAQRLVHKAQRRIWAGHTFANRANTIAAAVRPDLAVRAAPPQISVLVSSYRPHQFAHVIAGLSAQRGVDVQLVYLAHGFEVDEASVRHRCTQAGLANVVVLQEPRTTTLGECLNILVAHADGKLATKWDDDDVYSPLYLLDQANAMMYSEAEVVGKRALYMHLAGPDVTILRSPHLEHRFVQTVAGPTIFATAELLRSFPFARVPRGEDSRFLNDVTASGARIYAGDRFNYCQMRAADVSKHTWAITNEELLASSQIQFFGKPDDYISV